MPLYFNLKKEKRKGGDGSIYFTEKMERASECKEDTKPERPQARGGGGRSQVETVREVRIL